MEQRVNIGGTSIADKSGKLSAYRTLFPETKITQKEEMSQKEQPSLFSKGLQSFKNYRDWVVDLGYNSVK